MKKKAKAKRKGKARAKGKAKASRKRSTAKRRAARKPASPKGGGMSAMPAAPATMDGSA